MRRGDDERATAYQIAGSTEDLGLRSGVPGNLSLVLQVAGEAKEDNALDLGHHRGVESLDGVIHHGGALAVAAGHDLGVGALGVGEVEKGGGGADGGGGGVLGQEVVCKGGIVRGADALASDLSRSEESLEASADLGANDGALVFVSTLSFSFAFFWVYLWE